MPEPLLNVLKEQPNCDVKIVKNKYALETEWAYTPILNLNTLSTLYLLHSLVRLDLLIAATDKKLLDSLGVFVASRPKLRSLKIMALGRRWPGLNEASAQAYNSTQTLESEQQLHLVRSMAWLSEPVQHRQTKLHLTKLELSNFCVCGMDYCRLHDTFDLCRLKLLRLTCFKLLNLEPSDLPNLRLLALGFRNSRMLDPTKCISNWSAEPVAQFLSGCHNLRALELIDRGDILEKVLRCSWGSPLHSVTVHRSVSLSSIQKDHNLHCGVDATDSYPRQLIERLVQQCNGLRHLSISVPSHWREVRMYLTHI